MKKNSLLFISILILITCTGCTVEYNINITESNIKETINIIDYESPNRTKQDILKQYNTWYPTFVNYMNNEDTIELENYNQKYNGIEYHQKEIKTLYNGYQYSYKYNYDIDDYHDAYTLAISYSDTTVYKRLDSLVLKTSNESFLCNYNYFDEAKINISVDPSVYKLNYTNAHNQKNNTYTWILNRNNCNDSQLVLTLDIINKNNQNELPNNNSDIENITNSKQLNDYILYIFLGVILLIIYLGYKWFMKFKEKNNDID